MACREPGLALERAHAAGHVAFARAQRHDSRSRAHSGGQSISAGLYPRMTARVGSEGASSSADDPGVRHRIRWRTPGCLAAFRRTVLKLKLSVRKMGCIGERLFNKGSTSSKSDVSSRRLCAGLS